MGELILVTGGARSGKSVLAETLAMECGGSDVMYLATAPRLDNEMDDRIQDHRKRRERFGWITTECELEIADVFQNLVSKVLLLDCMTLWLNNLIWHSFRKNILYTKANFEMQLQRLLAAVSQYPGTTIVVTNELGSGLVPECAESRLFRDLAGFGNQQIAAHAERVLLCVCGIPLTLKGRQHAKN